jgi:hypothetical protein
VGKAARALAVGCQPLLVPDYAPISLWKISDILSGGPQRRAEAAERSAEVAERRRIAQAAALGRFVKRFKELVERSPRLKALAERLPKVCPDCEYWGVHDEDCPQSKYLIRGGFGELGPLPVADVIAECRSRQRVTARAECARYIALGLTAAWRPIRDFRQFTPHVADTTIEQERKGIA